MGKKRHQKFTDVWANQTALGKQFGLSAPAISEKLKELGLRGEDGHPTDRALAEGYCISTPLKDGTPLFMWNRRKTEELMRAHGYQLLDPREVKARELADRWVHVHKQWQEVPGEREEQRASAHWPGGYGSGSMPTATFHGTLLMPSLARRRGSLPTPRGF
jgi:hypothetical protein